MRIGIDLHGVLDTNPNFFVRLAEELKHTCLMYDRRNEVHIITGMPWSDELKKELCSYHPKGYRWWTHFHSITDHLLDAGIEFEIDEQGNKSFPEKLWNSNKAQYCALWGIDIMYDDSPTYGKYFVTPYVLYQHSSKEERKTYNKKELFN